MKTSQSDFITIRIFRMGLVAMAMMMLTACGHEIPKVASSQERIEYVSSNVDFLRDVFAGRLNDDTVTLSGTLYLPEGDGPFPVVIHQHGSGPPDHPDYKGWRRSLRDRLLSEGIGFFIADSYSARGISETGADQRQLSMTSRIIDALRALEALGRHPRVDGDRIGITGLSFGGIVAFGASHEPSVNSVLPGGPRFKAHVPMYPGCTVYERYEPTGAPLLFLLGGADNLTPVAGCLPLIESMKAAGAVVDQVVYPGAHHGFISSRPVYFNQEAWTFKDCGQSKLGVDGEISNPAGSSSGRTWSEWISIYTKGGCATRGGSIGRNEAAAKDALERVVEFFVEKLK